MPKGLKTWDLIIKIQDKTCSSYAAKTCWKDKPDKIILKCIRKVLYLKLSFLSSSASGIRRLFSYCINDENNLGSVAYARIILS